MEDVELPKAIEKGEDSKHQFKKIIDNPESFAAEIVAFANSKGGSIFVGVNDDGTVSGLTSEQIRKLNQLVSNVSSQGVQSPINVDSENISLPSGVVVVITVREGISKPYMDKNGAIWVKTGSDKRKATSREEIQRIFQTQGIIHADETEVGGLTFSDIDFEYFKNFFLNFYGYEFDSQPNSLKQVLENMNLMHNDFLDIAGTVLFAKDVAFKLPEFVVKAVAYYGNEVTDSEYIDKTVISGKLADIFQQTVSFVMRNSPKRQNGQNFNSISEPIVPRAVIEELIVKALVHRDYFVSSSVKVFLLDDRIEIISPGHLPNNLTVDNIKAGNSVSRNPIIASYASKMLPYSGIGTGIRRALRLYGDIDFYDDREGNAFKVVIKL